MRHLSRLLLASVFVTFFLTGCLGNKVKSDVEAYAKISTELNTIMMQEAQAVMATPPTSEAEFSGWAQKIAGLFQKAEAKLGELNVKSEEMRKPVNEIKSALIEVRKLILDIPAVVRAKDMNKMRTLDTAMREQLGRINKAEAEIKALGKEHGIEIK